MGKPLLTRERTAGREAGVRQRLFEVLRVPLGDLAGEGLLVVTAVEEVEIPVEQLLVRRPGLEHDVAAVAGREDTVDLDELGSDAAGVAGLLDVVTLMQVVQCVDDVHSDVGARAAARFPDRGARGTDEQLYGAGRRTHPVRRADDGITSVHDGVPREISGEPQLLDEVCQRFQLAAPQTARALFRHDRSSFPERLYGTIVHADAPTLASSRTGTKTSGAPSNPRSWRPWCSRLGGCPLGHMIDTRRR